jgi:hypothetical protein
MYTLKNKQVDVLGKLRYHMSISPEVNHFKILEQCDKAINAFIMNPTSDFLILVPIPFLWQNAIILALHKLEAAGFKVHSTHDKEQIIINLRTDDGWRTD